MVTGRHSITKCQLFVNCSTLFLLNESEIWKLRKWANIDFFWPMAVNFNLFILFLLTDDSSIYFQIGENSRRFYRFVKKHILHRKKDTTVKNINILPEDYHTTWALRSASSAASRSSVDSASSMDSTCSGGRNSGLEIVHDMEHEIVQDMENEICVDSWKSINKQKTTTTSELYLCFGAKLHKNEHLEQFNKQKPMKRKDVRNTSVITLLFNWVWMKYQN